MSTKPATLMPLATEPPPMTPMAAERVATEMAVLPTVTPSPTATVIIYTVQESDTLWDIAVQFELSMDEILSVNNLSDGSHLQIGQKLIIPSRNAAETLDGTVSPTNAAETTVVGTSQTETDTILESLTPAVATPAASPTSERRKLPNSVHCPQEETPVPAGATVVGYSAVCDLPIVSYRFGEGEVPVILVSGMHGGYEWNTIQLAYEVYDYFQANPEFIPPSLSVYLIPNANPDGLYAVTREVGRFTPDDIRENTVPGRFNGNNVDLNRNWDCNWSSISMWRDQEISGGSAPFSEPENQALRQFILNIQPELVLFWHSAARGVYAAGCGAVDPLSKSQAQIFGSASGYPVYDSFQHYAITGDASDWLSSQNIPSFTVELATHEFLDWDMNLAGMAALFQNLALANE
ncbi:MAG: M14 family zinc carboxypeptidase [Candidatus Promineifilaceae bacterium]|nr:M14 family zinc carboxypeptidase [Candidatus Promineifilaceae bacterium]